MTDHELFFLIIRLPAGDVWKWKGLLGDRIHFWGVKYKQLGKQLFILRKIIKLDMNIAKNIC